VDGITQKKAYTPTTQTNNCALAPAPCFLSPHVYFCADPSGPVVLDARSNRYETFTPAQSRILARHVTGWPSYPSHEPESSIVLREDRFIARMLSKGLLTRDRRLGKPASPIGLRPPQDSLIQEDLDTRPRVASSDVRDFYHAMLTARMTLLTVSFKSIISVVHARRTKALTQGIVPNLDRVRHIVASFHYLRPLIFNGRKRCLLHALALLEWLSASQSYPTWVFGVTLTPWFRAHCWLQDDDHLWTGDPEDLDGLTPILAI
jgi:hypothetical protein